MRELAGRVAVITGGGGGIGRGMALAFAERGMHVALSDVDPEAGRAVCDEVAKTGVRTLFVEADVGIPEQVEAMAGSVYTEFGEANVLCNNAGVSTFDPMHELRLEDWNWVLSVNLHGVIHGIQAFLPRMVEQEGPAHIVNTASIAGLQAMPGLAPYAASKFAVVAISETLRAERDQHGVGCSVLCPGFVDTGIANSERNRPPQFGGPSRADASAVRATLAKQGMDPLRVGRMVRHAVEEDEFYIVTHANTREGTETRLGEILAAYDVRADREAAAAEGENG
jgi:NAD(P)-dependent dehydrogenase (short-subunit alcohol dehydrogenase family)